MTKPDYTRKPYNYDPDDQPAPVDPIGWDKRTDKNVAAEPPKGRFKFVSIVDLADKERRARLVLLNEQAQGKALERDTALTERAQKWAEYEYGLIHNQINAIIDQILNPPPNDLMSRPNVSKQWYETIPKKN